MRSSATDFPVVGIGASAGGLEAMTQLLRALPERTGMALVLVQHLDPKHESAMATLLSRNTSMPVLEARNNLRLEPDHVYVIPPNKLMVIADRRLKLSPRSESKDTYAPIDHFLKSLAEEEGNRAIGVILSGSGGSDGTTGCLAIKAAGGITLAQDEKTSKYPGMPAAAVAAGCVDFVLPPDKIARELSRIAGHPYIGPSAAVASEREMPAERKDFEEILTILRRQTAVDFTHYKHATLRRRIQRRMVLHKLESLRDYAAYLNRHPGEVKELFNDILIHVTGFFRDPSVFQTLKRKIFPRLIKNRRPEEPIRIWVPGCSTGEEVYSLAMALTEFLQDRRASYQIQIFGTDINEAALEKARVGLYPDTIAAEVSPERLRQFFFRCEQGYRIHKSVREMCIFARQNVVTDPPFSNLDLVSCRNLLIYLSAPLQRKVLPLFHYALKPTGYLLLGISETIGVFADLFTLVDKKAKVYGKKATTQRPAVTFAAATEGPAPAEAGATGERVLASDVGARLVDVQRQADRIVLTHHGPAGVIINAQCDVLQFRGRTGNYLEHGHGEATLNVLKMARQGLLIPLRTAIARASKQNARTRVEGVHVRENEHFKQVDLEVIPFQVPPSRERYFLVLFTPTPLGRVKAGKGNAAARGPKAAESAELLRMREELASTRESLQAIIEEQEATNEELRSANEEIMSSNEELQSTNEELETAKEELQSTNEELATLNEELENRNSELEQVNNDLQNLLASVHIPIVMVGADLRIRRFTTVAEPTLNLIPADIGRPLTDINLRVRVPDLAKVVTDVIEGLQTREMEVQDQDNHWWLLRIRPYKTTDYKIDGAVLSFVDIDALRTTMERAAASQEFSEAIVNAVRHPLVVLDHELAVNTANDAFYRSFQVKPEETLGVRIYELGGGQWNIPELRRLLEDILLRGSTFEGLEVERDLPRVGKRRMILDARRLKGEAGREMILLAIEERPAQG